MSGDGDAKASNWRAKSDATSRDKYNSVDDKTYYGSHRQTLPEPVRLLKRPESKESSSSGSAIVDQQTQSKAGTASAKLISKTSPSLEEPVDDPEGKFVLL